MAKIGNEVVEMTKKENELVEILYTDKFTESYTLEDDINLSLNSIAIFGTTNGIDDNVRADPVEFSIRVVNGKKYIYPLEVADSYFLQAKRLIRATVLEIKAEDCYESSGVDGDFYFVLKENK